MSFIDSILKRFSPQDHVQKSLPAGLFGFFSPSSLPKWGEKEALQAYTQWVYACTNAIAERVADIDLTLEKKVKDDWQKVDQHPALDLLHDVNNFTSFYELIFLYEVFQQLNGNSFWVFNRNGNGNPAEIWQFDPTRFQIVKDEKNFISGYVYTPPGKQGIPLDIDEVIHFKRPNPNDPYRGIGTVQAAALAIDIDKHASEWQRNFFANAAVPSGVLSTEGTLTDEQFLRLKAQWDDKYKGVPNAHKMAIMEAGMTWTNLTPTSREMQFTESRKNIRDEILAIFKVPKPILGILEDVNLASAAAVKELFAENVLRPRMKALATGLNEFYLPMWKLDQRLYRFNFTDPVPQNIDTELQIIASGRGGNNTNPWMTINEARARFKYEPVEGGDELERSTMDTPVPGTDQPDDPAHTAQDEEEEEDVEDNEKSVKKNITKGKPIERTQEAKDKEQAYKQEQIKKLHETYLGLNDKLKKELVKRAKKYKPKAVEDSLLKRVVREIKEGEKVGLSNELIRFLFEHYDDWIGLVYNATLDGITDILEQSGKDTFADLNLEGSFDLQNPRALDWLKDNALSASNSYSDTMKEDIGLVVQEGVEQGLSNEKIADGISQFFEDQSNWRSMRIARTETINAYGQGNLEGFKQAGPDVISGKFWIPDSEACPICVENGEAGVIPLDADFPSGDQAPTAHPACECSLGGQTNQNG